VGCGQTATLVADLWCDEVMPRLIDTDRRTGEMVSAISWVLLADGIPGLTMRRIAQESGISTGSLLHHFGSRERMLRIAAHRTGRTLISAEESDSLWVGLGAFLPVDEEMRRLTSAWLAWLELGRSQAWLEGTVTDLRSRERDALSQMHERRLDESGLDTLVAVLHGLRVAVCLPVDAMPLTRARDLLVGVSSALMSAPGGGVVADAVAPGEAGDAEAEGGGEGGERAEP
jgi:AcrR family transcriptional regulator